MEVNLLFSLISKYLILSTLFKIEDMKCLKKYSIYEVVAYSSALITLMQKGLNPYLHLVWNINKSFEV